MGIEQLQGEWQSITDCMPLEGVLVDTRIDDGRGVRNEAPLRREGRLWFFSDYSMYVYYEPTHFRWRGQENINGK